MTTLIELIATNNTEEALKLIPTLSKSQLEERVSFEEDFFSFTALHYAALLGLDKIVQSLIDHGADVRARDRIGRNPMHYAMVWCTTAELRAKLNITYQLHQTDAFLRFDHDDFGDSPLHLAAMYDQFALVKYLVDIGCSTRDTNNEGKTPKEMAPVGEVRDFLTSRNNNLQTRILCKLKETIKDPNATDFAKALWTQFLATAPEHLITQYVELDERSPRLAVMNFNRAREAERTNKQFETVTVDIAEQTPEHDPIDEIANSFTLLNLS